ncbi:autotransporter outer membrane beta-barrel domain-containing protein, partial [Stenotrophomonas maltophilia]|uniref:autotransporter family protein n=1 Tax=Stenotrophomonas maltophilia TaxID=40324 RepID=UPI0039C463D0
MHMQRPSRSPLTLALAAVFLSPAYGWAQQIIADGDEQHPAPGQYHTTEPVTPGDPAGHAFLALNGGRIQPTGAVDLITEGRNAHAAHAEGAGSHITLQGGSIVTSGAGAAGLSVAAGASLTAVGVAVETRGNSAYGLRIEGGSAHLEAVSILSSAHGVWLADGDLQMRGGSIALAGGSNSALRAMAGSATLTDVAMDLGGGSGTGVLASGASQVDLLGGRIVGTGFSNRALLAESGARVSLTGSVIDLQGGGTGLIARQGARVDADTLQITVAADGRIAEVHEAELSLRNSTLRAGTGIWMGERAQVTLDSVDLRTEQASVEVQGNGGAMTITGSRLESNTGSAIWMPRVAQLTLHDSEVLAHGAAQPAIDVRAGLVHVTRSSVRADGAFSPGIVAQDDGGGRPLVNVDASSIRTDGEGAAAAVAWSGGTLNIERSHLLTTGRDSPGVVSAGAGAMHLIDTHVRTEGEGSWAAIINDRGRLQVDGGSLISAWHGGVWVRSTRDTGFTLGNAGVVVGGNGIALALDAAVAGRFDVAVESGSYMWGDIVTTPEDADAGLVPQSQVHMRLDDAAVWLGTSNLVQTLTLARRSQWTLTGDANVGELEVRDSTVALSDGRGGFNTLTVAGDLHSEGATFLFNGALGDDSSAIDRLHVRGDTRGDASIIVKNIGGMGADTVDGIGVIDVDGASLATYALAGRAVGGSHEYFLFQGGLTDPNDGNWYLRSQLGDRCELVPTAPGCEVAPGPGPDPGEGGEGGGEGGGGVGPILPPPVLRPEAGAYLANQSAAVNMFGHRLHDRGGALSPQGERHAWARVGRSHADFSAVGGQLSVDGNTSVLQIGSDVLRRGDVSFGVMLGNGRADSSVVSALTGYSAKGRVRGTAVGVYGTWLQQGDAGIGAYVDANLQYGRFDNRVQGVGLEAENYDSHMASVALEGGYTFNVWHGAASTLYVQPQLQLNYVDFHSDRHVETNGTVIDRADAGGLSGRVGVRVFGHCTGVDSILQPYAAMNWLRGSGHSRVDFNQDVLGADVPRNRYEVQAGAELKLGQRWGAWGGMTVQRGDHGYRNVGGQLGVRMAW